MACYTLTNCLSLNTINITYPSGTLTLNDVISIDVLLPAPDDVNCWTVTADITCEGTETLVSSILSFGVDNCTTCQDVVPIRLQNCEDTEVIIQINYVAPLPVGSVVSLDPMPSDYSSLANCWTVMPGGVLTPSNYPVTTVTDQVDCETCLNPPTCYQIENCQVLGVSFNISYSGVLNINDVLSLAAIDIPPGYEVFPNCWRVLSIVTCDGTESAITTFTPQVDCMQCLGLYYILQPCDFDGTTLCTNSNLEAYLEQTITGGGLTGCYTVSTASGVCESPIIINTETVEPCECPHCYNIVNCNDELITYQVSTPTYPGLNVVISITSIFPLDPGIVNCWTVKGETTCLTAIPTITYNVEIDCPTCTSAGVVCYKLTSCDGQTVIYSTSDLSAYVTPSLSITNVPGYTGQCFLVEEALRGQCFNPIDVPSPTTCTCECYKLVDCTTDQDYLTLFNPTLNGVDLSLYVGQVIGTVCAVSGKSETCVNGCWRVEEAISCSGAVPRKVLNFKDSCEICTQVCYGLKDCDTQQIVYTVSYTVPNTNPSIPNPATLVGQVLGDLCFTPAAGGCVVGCYELEIIGPNTDCLNAINWTEVVSYNDHPTCLACKSSCYLLEPCDKTLSSIIVNNNLSSYLNEIIKVCVADGCACYTVKPSQTCEGAITIANPTSSVLSCDECTPCYCPPGYEKVGDVCQRIVTVPATPGPTTYIAAPGDKNAAYGSLGTNFYNNITTLPFPLTQVGLSNFQDAALTNLTTYPSSPVNVGVWASGPNSRLNTVGIWTTTSPNPINEWIGFTACVDIPSTKTYCIGVAGDNKFRLSVDGTLIVQALNVNVFNFNFWHVFEITLTQGFHVFKLEGWNDGGAAAFGAEVYNATSSTLQAFTTAAQLQDPNITIFSTFNKIGTAFSTGINSGYICPPGSTFSDCGSGPSCTLVETIPYIPCQPTYKVVDCDGIQKDFITNTDLSDYVNNGYFKVCIPEPPTLLLVEPPQPYAYTLTDCKGIVSDICTVTNLYQYLDTYVVLNGYTGSCFLVTAKPQGEPCEQPVEVVVNRDATCECNPVPNPAWPPGCYCVSVLPADPAAAQPFLGDFGDGFASCEACKRICYLLTDCKGLENPIVVTGIDLADCVGGVIKIKDCEDVCWRVSLADSCDGCIKEVTVLECFPAPVETKVCSYTNIVTNESTDIIRIIINGVQYNSNQIGYCNPQNWIDWLNSLNLGVFTYEADSTTPCPIITIIATGTATYGDLCYIDTNGTPVCAPKTCVTIPVVDQTSPCDLCSPPPVVVKETIVKLNTRAVAPGYTTPVCSPEYYDKVNCTFAEQTNSQMLSARYGLHVCCDENPDKWDIKKELLDLQSLKNPNLP
jgi:hypothetical protein